MQPRCLQELPSGGPGLLISTAVGGWGAGEQIKTLKGAVVPFASAWLSLFLGDQRKERHVGPTSSPPAPVSPLVFISHALWDLQKLVSAFEPQFSPLCSGKLIPTLQSFGIRHDGAHVCSRFSCFFSPRPHPTACK